MCLNVRMARNDAHSPKNMDPQAYTYVGGFDNDPQPAQYAPAALDYMARLRGLVYESGNSVGHCNHCGVRIRYVAVLRHTSGEHIAVGETCLDNRFSLDSKAEFDAMRKAAELDRAKQRIKAARREFLDANPDLYGVVWDCALEGETWASRVAHDMERTLERYGTLSEKQVALAKTLKARHEADTTGRARIEAERAAEREAAAPAPTGRATITGIVLKAEWRDTDFGSSLKITVKSDDGWIAWGTAASSLGGVEKGDRVQFTASFEPKADDPKFAFYKRPTKATVLEQEGD